MNKKIFVLLTVFASLLTLGLLAIPNASVLAQAGGPGCVDATGAPCTATPEPSTGGGGSDDSGGGAGGNNQNPPASVVTATFTAIPTFTPTSTPFPISLPEDDYLGSCNSDNFFECKEQFKCEDGLLVIKVDLYSGNGTQYDFYCIPHEETPLLDLPLTLPETDGTTANWTGVCFAGELDPCLDLMANACAEEGGEYSEWYGDDGSAGAYCQNESEAGQVAPTLAPEIVAAPTDDGNTEGNEDWDEQCSWASCWAVDLACWMDGGSGYGVDDGAGGVIYHCDVPAESNSLPPSSWFPWVSIGIIVLLVGILLPAVQKVRQAAPKSKGDKNKKNWIEIESMNTGRDTRQTKEHVLLNKDAQDDSDAGKPKPKPKPKPTPPPSQPNSSDLESWRVNYGQSSQGKPKPSSEGIGDIDSDGDVDGRDFNP